MQREEEASAASSGHTSQSMSVGQTHISHTHSQTDYDDEDYDDEDDEEDDGEYDEEEEDEPVGYYHVLYYCQSTLTLFRIP